MSTATRGMTMIDDALVLARGKRDAEHCFTGVDHAAVWR